MTHLTPAETGTPMIPARPSSGDLAAPRAAPPSPRLDRAGLQRGLALRRNRLAALEAAMVAACEQAAARDCGGAVRIDDRETWDRATWHRYLAEATRLEPEYGPGMRRLWQEIGRLEALMALPLAA